MERVAVGLALAFAAQMHGGAPLQDRPPILEGYGNVGFAITTSSPDAQAYFDNGMTLALAFENRKAVAAMKEAVRLDPDCAMCLWGQAYAGGPNVNFTLDEGETREAAALVARAEELAASKGTPKERALIAALNRRYHDGGGRRAGDLAYAEAMRALASRYPTDNAIAVLAAEAETVVPIQGPQDFQAIADKAKAYLLPVLDRNPDNTGAIHYYIHVAEVAGEPEKALRHAERLPELAPNASHLVHMPSHVYYWTGRYQEAADINMRAVQVGLNEAKRRGLPEPAGVWGLPYHRHNVVFGLGGALMAGDSKTALHLGRALIERAAVDEEAGPYDQTVGAGGYFAMARFARPEDVLALPEPKLPFLKGFWHYARGEAFAAQNDLQSLKAELNAIPRIVGDPKPEDFSIEANQALAIARHVLTGRIAMLEGRHAEALNAFEAGAKIQEGVPFKFIADPPLWWFPVQREIAAARLAMGDEEGARAAAAAALEVRPLDPVASQMLDRLAD